MSLAMRGLAALVILGSGTLASLSTGHSRHNYCLVGAGPGGIQLGHFFSASRSCLRVRRACEAGPVLAPPLS